MNFEGDSTIILNGEKLELSKDPIELEGYYYDLRYPNEINQLSKFSSGEKIPFGYGRWYKSEKGKILQW